MDKKASQLRTLSLAMLIIGTLVELAGIALMLRGAPLPLAVAVLVPGLVLTTLGGVLLARGRQHGS